MKNELGRPKAYWQSINCDEKLKALVLDGPAYKVTFFPLVSLIHLFPGVNFRATSVIHSHGAP